jgi:TatD DNase family protein
VIDTHAHLDALEEPAAAVLARARQAGVRRVITIGTGIDSGRRAVALADREEGVYAALGIHPHEAGRKEAARVPELRALLGHDRAVAVGETGLDHFRNYAPRDAQQRLFEKHLALAAELELPVVVHCRAAAEATADVLAGFRGRVVLHCFSEPALLPVALERGYWVSFAGNVTYPRGEPLRAAAAAVPTDRILVETDCPYLAPQPVRGRPNEPAFVVHTAAALATARGEEPDELAAHIEANAAEVFSLP